MPALRSCLHRPSSVRPLLARVAAEVRPPTGLVELISHVLMRADAIVAYTCEVHQAYNPAACGETQRARQARANLGRGVTILSRTRDISQNARRATCLWTGTRRAAFRGAPDCGSAIFTRVAERPARFHQLQCKPHHYSAELRHV
jgi:hypothetical protein